MYFYKTRASFFASRIYLLGCWSRCVVGIFIIDLSSYFSRSHSLSFSRFCHFIHTSTHQANINSYLSKLRAVICKRSDLCSCTVSNIWPTAFHRYTCIDIFKRFLIWYDPYGFTICRWYERLAAAAVTNKKKKKDLILFVIKCVVVMLL